MKRAEIVGQSGLFLYAAGHAAEVCTFASILTRENVRAFRTLDGLQHGTGGGAHGDMFRFPFLGGFSP